jgi:hypothetical protein
VNARLERRRIEIEGVGVDVDEHRHRPEQGNHFCGRGEGESGDQDRVARAHAERHESQCQRIGAARAGDRVGGAAERGQARLELGDLGAHDVLPVRENAGNRGIQSVPDPRLLGFQIDEPNLGLPGRASCRRGRRRTNGR